MKRIGLAIGAAAVLVVSSVGMATAAGGAGDSVSGAIKRTSLDGTDDVHFVLSAHDGPNGAHGTYHATYNKGKNKQEYYGRVVCVNAVGNRALVEIQVTKSTRTQFAQVGQYEIIRVIDNGNPNDGGAVDALSPGVFSATPQGCATPVNDVTPTYSGNLLVKDGG